MGDLGNWPLEKITPELIAALEKMFAKGRTRKIAAGLAGIPVGILNRWLDIGKDLWEQTGQRREPAAELFVRCEAARSGFVAKLQDQLTIAGAGKESSPGSAGWQLERLERDDFGATARLELTGPEGGPLIVEGRAAVGWADLFAIARETGQEHLLGLAGGSPGGALPRAPEVLPDSADDERAADGAARVPGS